MNTYIRLFVPVLAALAAACGTTSELQQPAKPETVSATTPAQETAAHAQIKPHVDLSGYDKVVVLDFTDGTDTSKLKPEQVHPHSTMMANNLHIFSDLIAQKISETKAYSEVAREPTPGKALVVSGKVTRLVEGNGTLRLLVGFGAGSSYFDAMVQLSDAESGNVIASASTDNNSWALGGGLAATQTVQSFMDLSATRIAARLRDGKKGPSAAKAN
ncbi:MAG TPA: DUF4410 domain-containing protein [Bryobacteraceae bacterium]|nr:DUF4410 domain-containing protein [Bryobacteraceae bacterium]